MVTTTWPHTKVTLLSSPVNAGGMAPLCHDPLGPVVSWMSYQALVPFPWSHSVPQALLEMYTFRQGATSPELGSGCDIRFSSWPGSLTSNASEPATVAV